MSRINTNVQSLLATRVLNKNNLSLNTALERISTGLRINSGKDDPAGLIASEALRASKVAITAAIDNAHRADSIVAVAEGGLQEVNRLLLELEDLVTHSANQAGLSPNEVSANQLQIDTILQSLNRIVDTTEFSGRKLLNGNLDFTVSGTTSSNMNISVIQINAAKIPEGSSPTVTVEIAVPSEFALVSATGGRAVFALSPTLGLVGQEALGISAVSTGSLGDGTVGFLATLGSGQGNDLASKNFASAQRVIRKAVDQVSSLRGRLGAFQKDVLAPTVNSLQVTFENTAAAESAIRDADFAVETSNLTRAQILVRSTQATLQIANSLPQSVLSLLAG
jgi:flagellin